MILRKIRAMTGKTKFESDLKEFFPDMYELIIIGQLDKHFWKLAEAMIRMRADDATGEVRINYQAGKISHVFKTENMTAFEGYSDNHLKKRQDRLTDRKK